MYIYIYMGHKKCSKPPTRGGSSKAAQHSLHPPQEPTSSHLRVHLVAAGHIEVLEVPGTAASTKDVGSF